MPRKEYCWLFAFPYLSLVEKVELYLSHHRDLGQERVGTGQP
jgi:hypothetical protein